MAATIGGPRSVRIQDGPGSRLDIVGGGGSRGWNILRSQWKDFVMKRSQSDCFMNNIQDDVEAPMAAPRPGFQNLSKDNFDRMYDRIMSHYTSDSPRTVQKARVWQSAYQSNNDLRALLGDPWLHRRDASWERNELAPVEDPAMAFMPTDWSNCLSEETLAELVIDAYSSAFCDAFLDGAISLVEVSNKWNAVQGSTLQGSASESSLQKPAENRRLRNTSPSHKALLEMGLVDQEATNSDGFTMSGLSGDTWDAWNSRNYHKCKPLDPFVKRIEKATEAQRPQRVLAQKQQQFAVDPKGLNAKISKDKNEVEVCLTDAAGFSLREIRVPMNTTIADLKDEILRKLKPEWMGMTFQSTAGSEVLQGRLKDHSRLTMKGTKKPEPPKRETDNRKFAFPMAKTNFPEAYEKNRIRERQIEKGKEAKAEVPEDEGAPPKWLIKVGKDGKTRFPYSLVSHRAFLESQVDPILKEKAKKIAPLRFSSNHF